MKINRLFVATLALGLSGLYLGAQQTQLAAPALPSHFAPVAPGERIRNLDNLKDEVRAYHACTCKCGCYAKDLDLEADRAIAFLRKLGAGERGKRAIVLDIDETSLSNWQEMDGADFGYNSTVFNAWVESAKAPAIPGTVRIAKEAEKLGIAVIFLTGRPEVQRQATIKNLHGAGYDRWTRLIMRQPAESGGTAEAFKSAERAKLVSEGYDLVLNVGDQWSDLRGKPEAEYSVKYPDPFYFIK